MSNSRSSMAEKYFTQAFRASSAFETSSQPTASSSRSLGSLKETYPHFIPRNREDYPRAVDEDDLDAHVLPAPTILYRQGLSAEDMLDDETSCHPVFYDTNESAQYFNDEDLFGRLNSESDYFQQGGDHEQDDSEEELSEEDMLFGSGWDTVTDGRLVPWHTHMVRRERVHTEVETNPGIATDVALRERIHNRAEDGARYFDADDLFEREDTEMSVYGRDEEIHCYSEDWDFIGKERERCWMIDE